MPRRLDPQAGPMLAALAHLTYSALRERCKPPACILRARVLFLVADALGIDLRPTPVIMWAGNPAFAAWVRQSGGPPTSPADWEAVRVAGGIVVQNGGGEDRPKFWGGHLVLRAGGYLLDPSAPDCDREHWGIALPPLAISDVDERFEAGLPLGAWTEAGCAAFYESRPDASERWRRSPDWTRTDAYANAVRGILVAVRALGLS